MSNLALLFQDPSLAATMPARLRALLGADVMAKLLVPETGEPTTAGTLDIQAERPDVNVIDAAARGAADGLRLALVVAAMLIAFVALIALANGVVGWAGGLVGFEGLTIDGILV